MARTVEEIVGSVKLLPASYGANQYERDCNVRAAGLLARSYRDRLKLPAGVELSEEEIFLAAWIFAYREEFHVDAEQAMKDVIGFVKGNRYLREAYEEVGVSFGEATGPHGVVEFYAGFDPRPHAICRMAYVYQAVSGYSFVESVCKVERFV